MFHSLNRLVRVSKWAFYSTSAQQPTHVWLRAEVLKGEKRTPLTPVNAKQLLDNGIKVKKIFSIFNYKRLSFLFLN
jgi:hypothetical protein